MDACIWRDGVLNHDVARDNNTNNGESQLYIHGSEWRYTVYIHGRVDKFVRIRWLGVICINPDQAGSRDWNHSEQLQSHDG
jgi:hypothetical protein